VTLHKFLAVMRRRKWMITSILLLSLLGSGAASALATRTYTATAGLYFSVRTAAGPGELAVAATFSQSQLASYATLVTTPQVLKPVADDLRIPGGVAELADQVGVTALDGTVVLEVSVTDTDPTRAARIANAVADQVITVVEDLSPSSPDSDQSSVAVTVVTPASAPVAASSPKVSLNLGAAVVLGLGLGVLLAVAREALDTRVRDDEDVAEVTGTPVVGTLGVLSSRRSRLVVATEPHTPQAEAYRQLRTNLQFLGIGAGAEGDGAHRVLTVTSARPGEGKSTAAANLAIALAETSARVLLVDADLRRPSVAALLGLEGVAGLTTVLVGQADVADVVQDWGSAGLQVLTSGAIPPNPTEILGSPAMRALLARLRQEYDYVVLDSAPLLPVADGAILARQSDGVLVLANATKVRHNQLADALRSLAQVDAQVLGVVLNEVARDESAYSYWSDGAPDPERSGGRGPASPAPRGAGRGGDPVGVAPR
jgi:succinoglycan biosynthesis transport protein ExoP